MTTYLIAPLNDIIARLELLGQAQKRLEDRMVNIEKILLDFETQLATQQCYRGITPPNSVSAEEETTVKSCCIFQ